MSPERKCTSTAGNMSEDTVEATQSENIAQEVSLVGVLGAAWGLAGVTALLAYAVYRLMGMTIAGFALELDWRHWTLLIVNTLFMAHAEGYRGFQKGYSPRVVARARHLINEPTPLRVILAPLFVMGYFTTTRRRLVSTYVLTIMIIGFIILFQQLSQPWRGMLDFGVVVGLSWGIVSIVFFAIRAFGGGSFDHSPELPDADK